MKAVVCGTLAVLLVADTALGSACAASITNQLKHHPAPYLALHGEDPVAWQLWNADTVHHAQQQNKIMLLSIGYFSCHWCHVMQRESYQNGEIASMINAHYIPVKIDRELEPALDRRLMTFTRRILGRGGWPMNVFITPDGYPIYSLLYVTPTQFLEVLNRLNATWQADQKKILDVVRTDTLAMFPAAEPRLDSALAQQVLRSAVTRIMQQADQLSGGFGNHQKFPSAPQLAFLLQQYERNPTQEVKEFLEITLKSMARLGLHDHLLGGFFRYSVDPTWDIPHFEKMLYDNANLAALYTQAAEILSNPYFEQVAHSTLRFMQIEMWHSDGAMVSAFSAVDENGMEGGSYLWQTSELVQLLSKDEYDLAITLWGLDRPAELEAGNHPRFEVSLESYAQHNNQTLKTVKALFDNAKQALITARKNRSPPIDNKLLAGWNALALSAFITASQHFSDQEYFETAERLRDFLVHRLWDGQQLHRALVNGQIEGRSSLEDYAYVAKALYEWAKITGDQSDYTLVSQIVEQGWNRFYRNNGWYDGDGTLLAPAIGSEMVLDAAMPSPSAMMISTSLGLAEVSGDSALRNRAISALNRGKTALMQAPFVHVSQLATLQTALSKASEP